MIAGDKLIVSLTRDFGLVTVEQLERLTGRQTLWRRLPKLVVSKDVFVKKRGSNDKYVYATYPIERRSEFTLEHELMITDIHIALHLTGKLMDWRQGKQDWRGEVHQDAFCTLEAEEKMLDLFIEADNGTMNGKDIGAKIAAYLRYFDQRGVPFRVLFVTTSEARARNLSRLAQEYVLERQRRLYLFTTIEQFKQDCLKSICYIPHDLTLHSIVPNGR